jgi:predicted house-cleaning noncanonical NTP pyrophosphatase (MazG superfamily)
MRTFRYAKLIRDKILDHMLEQGEKPEYRVLSDAEYMLELRNKLQEESAEMDFSDKKELAKELADLQEVLLCLAEAAGITQKEIEAARQKKLQKLGSFEGKVFVDTVAIPAGNQWIAYLEAQPERFPEIKGD